MRHEVGYLLRLRQGPADVLVYRWGVSDERTAEEDPGRNLRMVAGIPLEKLLADDIVAGVSNCDDSIREKVGQYLVAGHPGLIEDMCQVDVGVDQTRDEILSGPIDKR